MVKTWCAIMMSVCVLLLSACGGNTASSSEKQKLVVVSWGGDYQAAQKKAMFQPFVKETGTQLVEDGPVNIGKIKSMVQSGNVQWDVVDVLGMDVPKLVSAGLVEPIDYNVVKKDNLIDSAVKKYAVDIDYYSTVLSYNEKNLPNNAIPTSWADFFDTKKFPGSRALYKSPITTLEIALLADGVKPDQLYPLDVDRAFKKLDQIKSNIVWWEQGAQPTQLLSDKEVVLAAAWNGRIARAKENGQPLGFTYEQGILDSESWVVVKGSKNKKAAMNFIQFASQGEPQANLLKVIPYGPTNRTAFESMDKEYAKTLPTYKENLSKQVYVDPEWWNKHFDEINDRFQSWLIK